MKTWKTLVSTACLIGIIPLSIAISQEVTLPSGWGDPRIDQIKNKPSFVLLTVKGILRNTKEPTGYWIRDGWFVEAGNRSWSLDCVEDNMYIYICNTARNQPVTLIGEWDYGREFVVRVARIEPVFDNIGSPPSMNPQRSRGNVKPLPGFTAEGSKAEKPPVVIEEPPAEEGELVEENPGKEKLPKIDPEEMTKVELGKAVARQDVFPKEDLASMKAAPSFLVTPLK